MYGVFLDTETNGLNWQMHDILEIALEIVNLSTGEVLDSYSSFIQMTREEWEKGNKKSLAYTGISYEDLKEGKPKKSVKTDILNLFKKYSIQRGQAVFICQNPTFDRIFFSKLIDVEIQDRFLLPYNWLDLASMHWSKEIGNGTLPSSIELAKDKIAANFNIPPEKKPHRAIQGVKHLIECYEKVIGFPLKPSCV